MLKKKVIGKIPKGESGSDPVITKEEIDELLTGKSGGEPGGDDDPGLDHDADTEDSGLTREDIDTFFND